MKFGLECVISMLLLSNAAKKRRTKRGDLMRSVRQLHGEGIVMISEYDCDDIDGFLGCLVDLSLAADEVDGIILSPVGVHFCRKVLQLRARKPQGGLKRVVDVLRIDLLKVLAA
jgi:hypothetical protein